MPNRPTKRPDQPASRSDRYFHLVPWLAVTLVASLFLMVFWKRLPPTTSPSHSHPSLVASEATPSVAAIDLPTPINPAKEPLSILFAGDMMFDRSVWSKMETSGLDYPFRRLDHLFEKADLAIANLEGPVTDLGAHAVPEGPLIFRFEASVLAPLKQTGLDIVSLANNHTFNHGAAGLASTKTALATAGIGYFGDPRSVERDISATVIEKNDWKIGLIGWNTIEVSDPNEPAMINLIHDLRPQVDRIIVMPHWGVEYQTQTKTEVAWATDLIDAGADLIIGAHPHVVQGIAIIRGKPVIFSLGNCIFDQSWSEETQQAVAVQVRLGEAGDLDLNLIPLDLHHAQPQQANPALAAQILARIASRSAPELATATNQGLIHLSATDTLR